MEIVNHSNRISSIGQLVLFLESGIGSELDAEKLKRLCKDALVFGTQKEKLQAFFEKYEPILGPWN